MDKSTVMETNSPITWSISRRKLLNQCPRAFILKYGFRRKQGGFNRYLSEISGWNSNWRLMLRALRWLIVERLRCFEENINWIESDIAGKIRFRILSDIKKRKKVLEIIEKRIGENSILRKNKSTKEIDRLVEIACLRYHKLVSARPLGDILSGKIKRWYTFSRLGKVKFGEFELHSTPDIVWFAGRTCHLLRFSVQAKSKPNEGDMLENMSIVYWALSRRNLPKNIDRYVVHNLFWNNGNWKVFSENCDPVKLENSLILIKKDITAMKELHNKLGKSCDLSKIPLAVNKSYCKSCGHRDTCPGGTDLDSAKLVQSALEMSSASQMRN